MSQSTRTDSGPEAPKADHLFAGFIGLFVVIVISRYFVLNWPPLRSYLPILIYQDVAFWSFFAWCFYALLKLAPGKPTVLIAGWGVCILTAIYTAVNFFIYMETRSPLTYRLWLTSDRGRGIEASVSQAVSGGEILAPLLVCWMIIVAEALWKLAPNTVGRMRRRFHSPTVALLIGLYVLGAHFWTVTYMHRLTVAANPEWTFLYSLFERQLPSVADVIPAGYMRDFIPQGKRQAAGVPRPQGAAPARLGPAAPHRPMNVVMIVMESVGARRLQHYGASYQDTPELVQIADHGLVFDHIYAAQAYTSAAMPGLFCSLYPEHGSLNILRLSPTIGVPGLADVLAGHGYRTAFMHGGQLVFDNQSVFVESHGFQQVCLRDDDPLAARDSALLPTAEKWIAAESKQPFFLAIWTQDTHHPYLSASADDYHSGDQKLNRYLNAVHSTDAFIAQLVRSLKEMNLADNTIVVITGDHGEAFGEHGQLVHGFTVYDEELHIPLVLVNPRIFPHEAHVAAIGRQIDVAPTLLGLLGYDEPASWQGTDLLGGDRPQRAYLFSSSGNLSLGFVEGNFKYIHDFEHSRDELYDLARDPEEMRDLSAEPQNLGAIARDHLRVEAWLSFQDKYLAGFRRAQPDRASVEYKIELPDSAARVVNSSR
jgi:arylsulfatase A-like enzyme